MICNDIVALSLFLHCVCVPMQPSRQVSANGRDDRAKKKQLGKRRFDDDIEDEDDPMAMIRSMFR